mgnify:FL=1
MQKVLFVLKVYRVDRWEVMDKKNETTIDKVIKRLAALDRAYDYGIVIRHLNKKKDRRPLKLGQLWEVLKERPPSNIV